MDLSAEVLQLFAGTERLREVILDGPVKALDDVSSPSGIAIEFNISLRPQGVSFNLCFDAEF